MKVKELIAEPQRQDAEAVVEVWTPCYDDGYWDDEFSLKMVETVDYSIDPDGVKSHVVRIAS